ncbi:MAG: hypothetical protein ACOC9Q_01440 [bacterium]
MSQFNTPSYDIPRTTGICAKTGRALEPGEPYFATLVEIPPEQQQAAEGEQAQASAAAALGMQRIDVSLEAWEEGFRPAHLFCFWKTTVPQPNEKKKLFVDDAVLMNLLRRLEDATEPQRLAFRYVLALILLRKKLLRFDTTERRTVEQENEAGQTETVEQEWWHFTPKQDVSKGHFGRWAEDETIVVLDPRLDEAQIEQVTYQLGEILEAEL